MKTSHKVGSVGAGALLLAVSFIKPWEGLWTTAKVDTIGTGHPVTYCYGQTNEAGAVKAGQKFTPQQCSDLLAKSLPKYWEGIAPCIKVDLPDKVKASLISGAYNAGTSAMCKSSILAKMNVGDIRAGCEAFRTWYIRASGRVVKGLINRRAGEARLCHEGLNEPIVKLAAPVQPVSIWIKLHSYFKG